MTVIWSKSQGKEIARIYRKAATLIESGIKVYCCTAIDTAIDLCFKFSVHSRAMYDAPLPIFRALYSEERLYDKEWFGKILSENQDHRVLALLAAAAYVETETSIDEVYWEYL